MKKLEDISLESKKNLEDINSACRKQLIDIYNRSERLYERYLTKLTKKEKQVDRREATDIRNELKDLKRRVSKINKVIETYEFEYIPFVYEIDTPLLEMTSCCKGKLTFENYARDFLDKVINEIRYMKIID
ncbi:hypothetical protein PT170_08855 [Erysipelothrix rhusiopathiae]|nr:hypothetical protein [Erysipelothrix rhusiopathiae]